MYRELYHLKENPFNVTADPDFFFSSSCHTEAFSHLIYGIQQRKGILLVTGEIGTGKTTLCRTILHSYRNHLEDNVKTALILNPSFSDLQLLQLILKDFGIEGNFKNKFDLINALNEFLLQETSQGHNIVLIIDEAQNLGVEQLEQIRLLSNLETEKQKLLQIVLVGQPELCKKLELPSLRQLNQRITVRYHVIPLKRDEIQNYIEHRLEIASLKDSKCNVHFTRRAIDVIYENSEGTPRLVNILCDRALLAGYTSGTFTIDERIVNKCIQEVGIKTHGEPYGNQSRQDGGTRPRQMTAPQTKKKKARSVAVLSCIIFIIAGLIFAIPSDLSFVSSLPAQENATIPESGQSKLIPDSEVGTVLQYAKGYNYDKQENSYKEVIEQYRKDAEQGDVQAQFNLGRMYKEGRGVEQDYKEAVKWYRKAAEQGDAQAQNSLGLRYEKGQGVEQDYTEAVRWYREAAGQGNVQAQTNLGLMYSKGRGAKQNHEEAMRWYCEAAQQGHARAQTNLGFMYSNGYGVEQDFEESVGWYREAAGQGDAQAQFNLGLMYKEGKGVGQDYKEAVRWYLEAAGQGHAQAQFNLGLMYSKGDEIERDYKEAVKWYNKAAEQGIDYAKEILQRLE